MTDSRTFTSAANHKFRLLGIYINAQTLRPASGCFKIERLQFVNRSKSQPRLLLSSALISAIDMNHNLEIMIIEMVCCERAANEQVGNLIIVVQSHWSDQTLFLEATIDFLVIRHESFITSCSIIVCFRSSIDLQLVILIALRRNYWWKYWNLYSWFIPWILNCLPSLIA